MALPAPMPVAPAIRNITSSWYLMASQGSAPARIWPVIMPGIDTSPHADIELMIGIRPLRTDSLISGLKASARS